MEEIHHYFEPYNKDYFPLPNFAKEDALGNGVSFYDGDKGWFLNVKTGVVIIGAPESRNGDGNRLCSKSPDEIRYWLYSLKLLQGVTIYDAGNLKGNKVKDRYKALQESVEFFCRKKTTVVVIGGTHELTIPLVNALNSQMKKAHLVIGDAMVDVGSSDDFTSRNWLHSLLNYTNEEKRLKIDFFAVQNYLVPDIGVDFLARTKSEVFWLGDILGQEINKMEVVMRQADLASIDFRCLENQPQWSDEVVSSHGLTANAACAISRYAGLSDKLKIFGLFETVFNPEYYSQKPVLAGQMIWHFIEGVAKRYHDYPVASPESYKVYYVPLESLGESLKFYQNPLNNRWWMSLSNDQEEVLVACSYEDYKQSLQNEIPNRWMRYNVE